MKLKELETLLYTKLNLETFTSSDSSMNGVQVGDFNKDIKRIALMVDASLEGFKQAKRQNVDLILVHHGLFWGRPKSITGAHFNRVKFLIENDIALYAVHLPLDAHMELGNNIGLAKKLSLKNCQQFGNYKGNKIGVKGELDKPSSLNDISKTILGNSEPVYMVPGGKSQVSTVAIVSGGSPFSVLEAIDSDIDLFITGDRSHEVYHNCIEEGINMISAGHYATETLGVKQVGEWLSKEFDIETLFIDLPTGA